MFAAVLWLHMEGAFTGSPVQMHDSFSSHMMIEIGAAVGFIGFGVAFRKMDRPISLVMRGAGIALLIYALFVLGFYRHWTYADYDYYYGYSRWPEGAWSAICIPSPWLSPPPRD